MKKYIKPLLNLSLIILLGTMFWACSEDFLDRQPLSSVTPQQFFNNESDLASYPINYYLSVFPNHGQGWSTGMGRFDDHTDNQATANASYSRFVKGNWQVPENQSLGLGRIRAFNYFLEQVLPKYKEHKIQGSEAMIRHYIGEVYMLRACENFSFLRTYGDFPIIRTVLPDQEEVLVEAAKRAPRNEFARFIISDLDSAILLLQNDVFKRNRITKDAAKMMKARVALFEASFLTYHKGTPRVPGEAGWPGANMSYNSGFSINLDSEINYFLTQAMEASKDIADRIALTENSYQTNPEYNKPAGWNPYFEMFGAHDMSKYPEIIMWRQYNLEYGQGHTVSLNIKNGANTGLTKGFVEGFLMANGLPIYAADSGYKGDVTLENVKADRDGRLQLFLAAPSDVRDVVTPGDTLGLLGMPTIIGLEEIRDVTGYKCRKFLNYLPSETASSGQIGLGASPVFRAAEAYLIYMEASYMKNKTIDATADRYWKALRTRAGVDTDYRKTIEATDMTKEGKGDWGAYSGGKLVDATLFNIRRERRVEFVSEGFRYDDLKRWRAMDQVQNYIIEGFNLWEENYKSEAYQPEYDDNGKLIKDGLTADGSSKANVSSKTLSNYLRPYQKFEPNNMVFNGYNWSKANYLSPIPYRQMQLASPDLTAENSNLYQNPYWPVAPGGNALE